MTVWVLFGQLDPIQHDDRPVDEGAEDLVSIHATEAGALEAKQRAVAKGGVEVWTHKIDGLTESDFVFSAKCDGLATRYRPEV